MHLTVEHQNIWSKNWLKGKLESSTGIIIGNFNAPFSVMYRSTRPKVNKETEDLKNIKDE